MCLLVETKSNRNQQYYISKMPNNIYIEMSIPMAIKGLYICVCTKHFNNAFLSFLPCRNITTHDLSHTQRCQQSGPALLRGEYPQFVPCIKLYMLGCELVVSSRAMMCVY